MARSTFFKAFIPFISNFFRNFRFVFCYVQQSECWMHHTIRTHTRQYSMDWTLHSNLFFFLTARYFQLFSLFLILTHYKVFDKWKASVQVLWFCLSLFLRFALFSLFLCISINVLHFTVMVAANMATMLNKSEFHNDKY